MREILSSRFVSQVEILLLGTLLFLFASCKQNTDIEYCGGSSEVLQVCTEGSVTTGACKVENAGVVVSSSFGSDVTSWANLSSGTSVTASIPKAFYANQNVSFTDADLLASNIISGVDIFGVTGSMVADGSLSNAHRNNGATQLTQTEEVTTHAGSGGAPDLPSTGGYAYRSVPDPNKDDDGADETNITKVDRTTVAWGATSCGDSQSTVDLRIADCASTFGAEATWEGAVKGNAGQGVWKLVSRTGDLAGGMGEEVWKDMRTGLLWSSKVSVALNWCKASGSNEIAGNPASVDDPSDYCDQAGGGSYQNTAGQAVSACFEDDGTFFTTTDGGISNAGKAGLGYTSTPSVRWRLPTIYDYQQANINGIRFVLPDSDASFEWSATVSSSSRHIAWVFFGSSGLISPYSRITDHTLRCVGR